MMDEEEFGQKRPPLSVTIKGILERYPDGQIFKVKTPFMQITVNFACTCVLEALFTVTQLETSA